MRCYILLIFFRLLLLVFDVLRFEATLGVFLFLS